MTDLNGSLGAKNVNVLLISADEGCRSSIAEVLASYQFEVAPRGYNATILNDADAAGFDVVAIDIDNKDGSGLFLCRRMSRYNVPIIALSHNCSPLDRVVGLEFGADHYIAKDCHPLELIASIRAMLRRRGASGANRESSLLESPWRFEVSASTIWGADGRKIFLARNEGILLAALMSRPRELLSRDDIRAMTAGNGDEKIANRSIDVSITRLRKKLKPCEKYGEIIKTIRGFGYIFDGPIMFG